MAWLLKVNDASDGGPATVVIAGAEAEQRAQVEVPMVAVGIPVLPAVSLGWKVVVCVPSDPVGPEAGENVDGYAAIAPVPASDQMTGNPSSVPLGQAELTVHVTVAVTEYGVEPAVYSVARLLPSGVTETDTLVVGSMTVRLKEGPV